MILSPPLGKARGTLGLKEPSEVSPGDPSFESGIPARGENGLSLPDRSPGGLENGEGNYAICMFITYFIKLNSYGPSCSKSFTCTNGKHSQ